MSRDYTQETKDNEGRKYFYGFDYDVMHPYMLKSFLPHFRPGNILELGRYKGEFTQRLAPHFSDITCVEASDEAVVEAKQRLNGHKVEFHGDVFENVNKRELDLGAVNMAALIYLIDQYGL